MKSTTFQLLMGKLHLSTLFRQHQERGCAAQHLWIFLPYHTILLFINVEIVWYKRIKGTKIEHAKYSVLKFFYSSLSTTSFWREHRIPISHLQLCHVLNYVQQLPSVILSHCHYNLRVGRGQEVVYDHQALEKHIMNRFINGKPLIDLDILQVIYRKEICTTGTFSDVRKKVEPQVCQLKMNSV
jgi:hypothetical protein